ncbi:MAG: hypothetical protein ABW321_23805 [Polyangiales bacterium]
MFAEGALRIELHRGTKTHALEVQSDRVLIGSGAHCDVRLAPDEAAIEQLIVYLVGDDEVYAQTRTLEPPCFVNGAPFLEGRLGPTSMLELGAVGLSVQRVLRQDGETPKTQRSKSSTSPLIQALGLLGVGVGFYVVLGGGPAANGGGLPAAVSPPPMAATSSEPCPQPSAIAARALADQLALEAESKRERSPFYPGDGLAAVGLFERAASCYASAREPEAAHAAHAAALALREHVGSALHVGHVRLERFLAEGKHDEARHQAQLLADLVTDKAGPYARWLSAVKREGELRR